MKIASMGRDTTALRKRRKVKMCLVYREKLHEIEGDPLACPNRHTRLKRVRWGRKRDA